MSNVTNLKGFFNPELSRYKRPAKKSKKARQRSNRAKQRLKVLKHFKLHDTASNAGICLCIHNETGWPMPGRANQYPIYIRKFARKLTHRKHSAKLEEVIEDFYKSKKWRELRFVALRMTEGTCELCGARASDGVSLHVDHIKPRSKYPALQYDLDNLQVLCDDCNFGKSNYDETDFRKW